ncbi:MAG: Glycine hydroxymethyltransferase [Chloroflexi bacterium]|nr:Glycine hydroxymethyltransferase [Chloroflexota bacterium]
MTAVRSDGALAQIDPELASILADEEERQRSSLALIASENYASVAVRQVSGSIFTNKYAEGYPGKRYYAGNQWVDSAEALAIERAKRLFSAEHANVQPHAGSQANMAAYFATLNIGDTVLAMELAQGGHLTHGASFNFSGKLYRFVHYGVRRDTEVLDYDEIEAIARREKPKLIVAGATAYPRIIDFERFRAIADTVGARLMVDMAHIAGLVAGGVHPSPVPHADVVTFTTHKTLRGPRGGAILCRQELARKVDSAVFPGLQGGPLEHAVAAKAVAFHEALQPEYRVYQRQVVSNCQALAAHMGRLGARIVSGGTDNHLFLLDLTPLGLDGQQASDKAELAGLILNKNLIPFDPLPPTRASGLRVGTACVTTRGLGESDMAQVGEFLFRALVAPDEEALLAIRADVRAMLDDFPAPFLTPLMPAEAR